jgi:hypothetical protein
MPIKISSNLDTKNVADVYATHLGNLTKGGVHTKDNIAAMNTIPVQRRTRMMLCVVADTGTGTPALFWLNTPPNPTAGQLADNNYWEIVPLGVDIEGVLRLLGFQNGAALTILDSVGSTGDTYIADGGGSGQDPLIFNNVAYTINVGDYLVYQGGKWNIVPTGATSVTWATLTGKPTTFTPSAHQHTIVDITDFPSLTGYQLKSEVVTTIDGINSLYLATQLAIINYVDGEIVSALGDYYTSISIDALIANYYTQTQTDALIDSIEGYVLYTSVSLAQLAIDVTNPSEGEFAYIQGLYSMYRFEGAAWVFKYLTSSDSPWVGALTTGTGSTSQNVTTSDISAQTSVSYFNLFDSNITTIGRVATGEVNFFNFKKDTTDVFKVDIDGNIFIAGNVKAAAIGLTYFADYTASFVARSLIDKGYADATYAAIGSGGWAVTGNTDITGNVNILPDVDGTRNLYIGADDSEVPTKKVANLGLFGGNIYMYSSSTSISLGAGAGIDILSDTNGVRLESSGSIKLYSNTILIGNATGSENAALTVASVGANSNLIITPKGTGTVSTSAAHTTNISANDDVITKGYADGAYALASGGPYLPLAGGTMGGNLILDTGIDLIVSDTTAINNGTMDIITWDASQNVSIPNGGLLVSGGTMEFQGSTGLNEFLLNSLAANPDLTFQENGTSKAIIYYDRTTNSFKLSVSEAGGSLGSVANRGIEIDGTTHDVLIPNGNLIVTGNFIKTGGTSSQFLKADGSVDSSTYSISSHTHLLAAGATDVTATFGELNLLDLSGLTVGWVLSADTATTASWKAPTGGGGTIGGSITDNQIAFGATTADDIEGINNFTYDGITLKHSKNNTGANHRILIENTSTVSGETFVEMSTNTTNPGDVFVKWNIATATSYALGIDNTDTDTFKLTYSASDTVTPSSGTTLFEVATNGDFFLNTGDFFLNSASVWIKSAGATSMELGVNGNDIAKISSAGLEAFNANGGTIRNVASALGTANINVNKTDTDTGLGGSTDILTLLAGGLEGIRIEENTAAIRLGFFNVTPVVQAAAMTTANATATDGTIGTADTIINNLRIRINELEAMLDATTGIGIVT